MTGAYSLMNRHNAHRRRSAPRVPAAGTGELTVISPQGEKLNAMVLDVSRSGLQLEVGALIEFGSSIQLQLRTVTVLGKVTNCREIGSGRYRVGVLIAQVIEPAQ